MSTTTARPPVASRRYADRARRALGAAALALLVVGALPAPAVAHDDHGGSDDHGSHGEHSSDAHAHGDHDHATDGGGAPAWPTPWDPAEGIDFSGAGATPAQQLRAAALIHATARELPRFADPATADALGYRSIGDAGTGFEHYIDYGLIVDDVWLDPAQPESLVYRVDGDGRTLVSAMFIVPNRAVDDPELVDFGGPLMQWHVHDNLCWGSGADGPKVVGIARDGVCPAGSVLTGGEHPMVHVWITPHPCGPFAALEGHGAGQTSGSVRTDQCVDEHLAHGHGDHAGH